MGGAIAGEILSKDDKTITVKLTDGGSKILLLSETTKVETVVVGTKDDLAVGKSISAFGKTNTDGSVLVESIQIRPTPVVTETK